MDPGTIPEQQSARQGVEALVRQVVSRHAGNRPKECARCAWNAARALMGRFTHGAGSADGKRAAWQGVHASATGEAHGESGRCDRSPSESAKQGMTLCFLSATIPPTHSGGIGRFVHDLGLGLSRRGHEVHVITRADHEASVDLEDGLWIHRVTPVPSGAWRDYFRLRDRRPLLDWDLRGLLDNALAGYCEVLKIRRPRSVDVIEVPIWDLEGMYCLMDRSLPTVLSLHTSLGIMATATPEAFQRPVHRWVTELEAESLRRTRFFHASSRAVVEEYERVYSLALPPQRVEVIPLGLPDHSAQYIARGGEGTLRILFVGRLEHRKGIDVLLDAIPKVVPRKRPIEYIIVGDPGVPAPSGGGCMERFIERQDRLPENIKVAFAGRVSESSLYPFYADCDIFVAPSRFESFGLVFLEAMMFGKPVVGCDAGGMPEVIEDGVSGYLAKPGDVDSLRKPCRGWLTTTCSERRWAKRGEGVTRRSSQSRPWSTGQRRSIDAF